MTDILIERSLLIIAIFSIVPLVASSAVAGMVVMLQTLVQVQEQTIVHLSRVCVGGVVLCLLFPYAGGLLTELLQQAFDVMEGIGWQR